MPRFAPVTESPCYSMLTHLKHPRSAPRAVIRPMSGLGGLNKTPAGVVLGLVQLQLPIVQEPGQVKMQARRIVTMVEKARRNMPGMDLVVFPEYALHGLSMSTEEDL